MEGYVGRESGVGGEEVVGRDEGSLVKNIVGGVGEGGLKGGERGERTKGESGGEGEGTHHGGRYLYGKWIWRVELKLPRALGGPRDWVRSPPLPFRPTSFHWLYWGGAFKMKLFRSLASVLLSNNVAVDETVTSSPTMMKSVKMADEGGAILDPSAVDLPSNLAINLAVDTHLDSHFDSYVDSSVDPCIPGDNYDPLDCWLYKVSVIWCLM